jgi:two-component system response regulator HydG
MKLADINRNLDEVFNTMSDGLIVIAPDGSIVMVNRSFEELTGYTADEVIGKPCTLLACDACELAVKSGKGQVWWCALFDPGQEGLKRCRCNYQTKDGALIPVLKNASVLRDRDGGLLGAVETLTDISELDRLDQAVQDLSRQLDKVEGFCGIVGTAPPMLKVFDLIKKAAASDAPVLVHGESGTGKELVARAIHQCGLRSTQPYVQFSCAALNPSLLESELFGHTKGAFTGAHRHRVGRFEAAHRGDIFLDEIGDVPPSTQVKLLRVLENRQVERVGDHSPVNIDVRIISATNQNLEKLIQQGEFRQDLYFRINIIPISLPPLRERLEDLPLLVGYFLERLRKKTGKPISGLSREVLNLFMSYAWPGNIRELKGALQYAFVVCEGRTIQVDHIPPKLTSAPPEARPRSASEPISATAQDLSPKQTLIQALRQCGGNQSQAAKLLGVTRVTVYNRMKKYGISLQRIPRD